MCTALYNVSSEVHAINRQIARLPPLLPGRGFGHGSVLKTSVVDLKDVAGKLASPGEVARLRFCNTAPESTGAVRGRRRDDKLHESLGWDGLPVVGSWVESGDPLYCVVDQLTGKVTVGKVKGCAPLQALVLREGGCNSKNSGRRGIGEKSTFLGGVHMNSRAIFVGMASRCQILLRPWIMLFVVLGSMGSWPATPPPAPPPPPRLTHSCSLQRGILTR